MTKEDFLKELVELMMLDTVLSMETELSSIEEYDSMTQLSLLSLFEDELGIQIETDDLIDLETVGDLVKLARL